jgi:hypothetical protein
VDPTKVAALLDDMLERLGMTRADVVRNPIRVWSMSGVERLRLPTAETLVFKYAGGPFADESRVLRHAAHHGVAVPRVYDVVTIHGPDGRNDTMGMLMEDLGPAAREARLTDAAVTAVAVHAVPPLLGRSVLNSATLAVLPGRALDQLAELKRAGRWRDARIAKLLQALADVAVERARDAEIPPYATAHSEFHPTSLLVDASDQCRVLDMARSFTGPGLLDLVSWQGTTMAPDLPALRELLHAYVVAGGAESVLADRAGLPADAWALGWHRIWAVQWYIEQALVWMPKTIEDAASVAVVVRHLTEATEALRAS